MLSQEVSGPKYDPASSPGVEVIFPLKDRDSYDISLSRVAERLLSSQCDYLCLVHPFFFEGYFKSSLEEGLDFYLKLLHEWPVPKPEMSLDEMKRYHADYVLSLRQHLQARSESIGIVLEETKHLDRVKERLRSIDSSGRLWLVLPHDSGSFDQNVSRFLEQLTFSNVYVFGSVLTLSSDGSPSQEGTCVNRAAQLIAPFAESTQILQDASFIGLDSFRFRAMRDSVTIQSSQ